MTRASKNRRRSAATMFAVLLVGCSDGNSAPSPTTVLLNADISTSTAVDSTVVSELNAKPSEFYASAAAEFIAMEERLYLDPDLTYDDVPAVCGEFQPVAVDLGEVMASYAWPADVSPVAGELTNDIEVIAKLLGDCAGLPGDPYALDDTASQLAFHFARFERRRQSSARGARFAHGSRPRRPHHG